MAANLTEEDQKAGDELDLLLNREVMLVASEQGGGKSFSIAMLCLDGLEQGFNVVVVDRDRGIAKAIREVFIEGRIESARDRLEALGAFGKRPENLDYFLADEWAKIPRAVQYAFETLGPGDWFCGEMIGRFWDFAQTEYSRRVYGEDLSEHLLMLRADAQKAIAEAKLDLRSRDENKRKEAQAIVSKAMQYSGLEGRTDWSVIKRMHNDDVFDRLVLHGDFNILNTTSLTGLSQEEMGRNQWEMFHVLGKRPEGEKHQVFRHDSIIVTYRKGDKFAWRTDLGNMKGKDRGRPLYRDVDFTDIGLVASYKAKHGL